MTTIKATILEATARLRDLTENPQREAALLLAHVLNATYEEIYFQQEKPLTKQEQDAFMIVLQRRLNHEPLSKIKEQREFWSLTFRITADTLDPRPDSETLIESVIKKYPDKTQKLNILDLGTGSGCLLLTLLHEYPNAVGVGIDRVEAACLVAQENARNLNLSDRASFVVSNWGDAIKNTFDIIISNPPYIGRGEKISKAVSNYDPDTALYGGEDGLEAYRALAIQIPPLTKEDSLIFLEMGATQAKEIKKLFCNYNLIKYEKDIAGLSRCAVFCMKPMPVNEA